LEVVQIRTRHNSEKNTDVNGILLDVRTEAIFQSLSHSINFNVRLSNVVVQNSKF